MTSKERLTRLFKNEEVDRIPIWLLFPYHRLGCYVDVYNLPSYKPLLPYIENYCDTLDRRSYYRGLLCYNANTELRERTFTEEVNGLPTAIHEISYRDMRLRHFVETTAGAKVIRHFIDDPAMLERIASIPYIPPRPDFSVYQKEKEELGDRGLMMMALGDPLVPLYGLSSAEDFAIWTLTDYDAMLRFTDEMYKRVYDLYKYYLDNDIGDAFFIVGAEFAGPPLVSPEKFKELSVRYLKGIIDLIRSYGKYSILHYHGNLYRVLDGMKEINPDGLHTIEAPPVGDCTLSQAREKLGNMILIGNLQYDDLRVLEKEELEHMVQNIVEEGRSGRFILSPTAGPYEESISDKMVQNYITFIETGIKHGGYLHGG
jgi:uroporphyrinogen-III decarboxylase